MQFAHVSATAPARSYTDSPATRVRLSGILATATSGPLSARREVEEAEGGRGGAHLSARGERGVPPIDFSGAAPAGHDDPAAASSERGARADAAVAAEARGAGLASLDASASRPPLHSRQGSGRHTGSALAVLLGAAAAGAAPAPAAAVAAATAATAASPSSAGALPLPVRLLRGAPLPPLPLPLPALQQGLAAAADDGPALSDPPRGLYAPAPSADRDGSSRSVASPRYVRAVTAERVAAGVMAAAMANFLLLSKPQLQLMVVAEGSVERLEGRAPLQTPGRAAQASSAAPSAPAVLTI